MINSIFLCKVILNKFHEFCILSRTLIWFFMSFGSIDGRAPPLFKQGLSALSKLVIMLMLSVFLMAVDNRFRLTKGVRATIATVLRPLTIISTLPVAFAQYSWGHLEELHRLQRSEQQAHQQLLMQSQRANQVELLGVENARLRQLLDLKPTIPTPSQAAEVLHDAADPFSRKIIINKGSTSGVLLGSPVIDEAGVLGQVVRVFPLSSEVALLIDKEQTTPVLNTRTGTRSVAYGNPSVHGDVLELRFISGNADVLVGDVLTTSDIDGVYPTALMVAKIEKIERRADSAFARIICKPKANVWGAKHVLVLQPLASFSVPPLPVVNAKHKEKNKENKENKEKGVTP